MNHHARSWKWTVFGSSGTSVNVQRLWKNLSPTQKLRTQIATLARHSTSDNTAARLKSHRFRRVSPAA